MLRVMLVVLGLISPFSGSQMESHVINTSTTVTTQQAFYKVPMENSKNQPLTSKDPFETVNDISLLDHKEDIIHKKGEPLHVNEISFTGCTDYEYDDMTIGICEDWVNYVHVDAIVGTFKVNGQDIRITEKQISDVLGTPQFHAEDGEVYIRGDQAIKVYNDPLTGTIQGIDFFDETSS